ncbi:MAG TPA: 5'-3' exonuclease H3TH domain-containing protein [Steroidobacteraceae bacterium]|jgi:5'-3' exonuclease|nr:5'-3' exonuclease H3TH domain-containing protein [Steroidobacteraceae bacterium]
MAGIPVARSGVAYFVDASYFIFRAYHSMPPDMVDAEGNGTHALYGFARFLSDLLEQVRPEWIGVAFDLSLKSVTSFRNGIYAAYKANRESPPADLERQFALCREFCRHMGLAEFASAEYEADDIIGTLAFRSRAAGLHNVLVTRDKDLSQLIRDGDVFWDYSGNTRYHYHDIAARFGVAPELIADFLALTGDSVDNIPGVPGVGKKTAAELFAIFGSLDELYENLHRIPLLKLRGAAAVAAKLLAHKEAAYLARRLTGIVCDMPIAATLDDLRRRPQDRRGLDSFFDTHGFGNILRQQVRRIAAAA